MGIDITCLIRRKCWLCLMLLAGLGLAARADDKIVGEVEVRGLFTISENEIKTKLETCVGNPLSERSLRSDIQRLHSLGFFSKVDVHEEPMGLDNRVKVVFEVEENRLLGEIDIKGNFEFDRTEILNNLRIAKEKYLDEYALSLDMLEIKDMYRKKGFLFAEVQIKNRDEEEPQATTPGEGWVDLSIIINEGPRVTIGEIQFFGNRFFSKEDLLAITQTQESGLFQNKYYDKDVFEEDLILMRNFYRMAGFLDARVELRDTFFSNDRTELTLNISVNEGLRYHIQMIVLEGNTLFSDQEIANRMVLKPQSPFQEMVMYEDKDRVEKLYGENGFLNIRVTPVVTIVDLENPLVDILYKIEEGTTTYIRKIDIEGNVVTRDDVIRRELLIVPGELFNLGKVETSQQRLQRLHYFETIKLDLNGTDEQKWKDLTIEVEEGSTGSLRFAAGITSDLGAVGEISLTKRNFDIADFPTSFADFISGESFTGAGQNLDIFFQAGKELLRFKVSFVEPYFLGYNLILGSDLYKTERVWESWDEGRAGGQISLGRRLDPDTIVRLSYRLEEIKISDVDYYAPPDVFAVKGKSHISSLAIEFTIDTSDDFILPTRGYILSASYEVAGVFLGGDYDFSSATFRAAWFQTIYTTEDNYKHVLSLGGRVGLADEHDPSDSVPIFERFFAGGVTSIRGFEYRTVSPKVNGDPVGGEFMILGSAEYGFPIYQDVLRGVLFVDAGNVIPRIDSTIFHDLRVSVGFGFRIKVPMLGPRPFALDFGFPVRKEDDDEKQIFSFSFGKPF